MFGEPGTWQRQVRCDGEAQGALPTHGPSLLPGLGPSGLVAPAWLWVGVAVVQRSRPALKALGHSRLLRWVVGSRPLNCF